MRVSDLLRVAAADVERRGIVSGMEPDGIRTTCAVVSIKKAGRVDGSLYSLSGPPRAAMQVLAKSVGLENWLYLAPRWNDQQSSRAVVAAEMRSAADFADLLGSRLEVE